jgi:triosephosphate isomerase
MIRSNPGLILLHGSVVVNKWPNTMLPAVEKLDAPLEQLEISNPPIESKLKRLFRLLLWYVLPLLAVTVADRLWLGKKMRELYRHRV